MSGRLPDFMPMTELLAQPPVMDLASAALAMRLSKEDAYKMARQGEFPFERRDHRYIAKLANVLRYLGFDPAIVAVSPAAGGSADTGKASAA